MASDISMRLPHLGLRVAEHSRRALGFAEQLQQVRIKVIPPSAEQAFYQENWSQGAGSALSRGAA